MLNKKIFENLSLIKSTNTRREFWNNHLSDDFTASLEIGRKQADEYLKYIEIDDTIPILASIVHEISKQSKNTKINQGQLIGFFTTLESALKNNL